MAQLKFRSEGRYSNGSLVESPATNYEDAKVKVDAFCGSNHGAFSADVQELVDGEWITPVSEDPYSNTAPPAIPEEE